MSAGEGGFADLRPSEEATIGIVAAFRREVMVLLRQRTAKRLGRGLYSLSLRGMPGVLAISGAGSRNSHRVARQLAAQFRLQALLTIGFAGGLVDSLKPGDIFEPEEVIEEATGERFACRTDLFPSSPAARGALLCTDSVAGSAQQKSHLADLWKAGAVDMESAGVARAAAAAGLPFAAVKSITDSRDQTMAIDFARCWSQDGNLSSFKVIRQALATRRGGRDLFRLARSSRAAAGSLAAMFRTV